MGVFILFLYLLSTCIVTIGYGFVIGEEIMQSHIFAISPVCLVPHFSAVNRVYVNRRTWAVGTHGLMVIIIHDVS